MTKPDDIPQSVWDTAAKTIGVPEDDTGWHLTDDLLEPIARAILAEREACAQVVRNYPQTVALSEDDVVRHGMLVRMASRSDLVTAIRAR